MPGRLAQIARAADDAGFPAFRVMDHFFQIGMVGPPENDMLECYATLGYLAASTARVMLGALVTGVIYRYPGILVKAVTTLDVLSGGRAYFGIGPPGMNRKRRDWARPFPRSPRALNCSRRHYRSRNKCGRPMTGLTMASTTASSEPCATRNRCRAPTHRFWSRVAAKRKRCAWWRNTLMPAICMDPLQRLTPNWRFCGATATPSGATMRRSKKPRWAPRICSRER